MEKFPVRIVLQLGWYSIDAVFRKSKVRRNWLLIARRYFYEFNVLPLPRTCCFGPAKDAGYRYSINMWIKQKRENVIRFRRYVSIYKGLFRIAVRINISYKRKPCLFFTFSIRLTYLPNDRIYESCTCDWKNLISAAKYRYVEKNTVNISLETHRDIIRVFGSAY